MIGILLVTHGEIGQSLINCAAHILDSTPKSVESLSIKSNNDLSKYTYIISQKIQSLEKGNGVLIMTDIYGATPCNLLNKFIKKNKVEVVTGVNLPMLVKAISDRKDNLNILINDSIECAKKNIKKI
jgi:mannose PTS system EIIA component|tara:strand:+ start:150 stop:530 length:381 start_codon:yes stop_codon:yes gene_type:complete